MELVVSLAIGVLAGSGVWLLLRPRTFQVIMGLSLLSYAVNLFIFSTGGLRTGAAAILERSETPGSGRLFGYALRTVAKLALKIFLRGVPIPRYQRKCPKK